MKKIIHCAYCDKLFTKINNNQMFCSKECYKISIKNHNKLYWDTKKTMKRVEFFNYIKKYTSEMKIECLSKEYKDTKTKLKWRCDKGHEWETIFGVIKSGSGCPYCSDTRLSIMDAEKLANSLGFKCISKEYINSYTPLIWECKEGHIWNALYKNVKSLNTGCPECNIKRNKAETKCREVFESYFNKEFKMVWPDWLIGPKGWPLQLDGYNEELKIAFEYNGKQHYKPTIFLKDTEAIKYQQECDALKIKICQEKGITLVIVPYTISIPKFKEYIINQLKK